MNNFTTKGIAGTSGWVQSALPMGVSGVQEMIRGIISAANGRSPGMVRALTGAMLRFGMALRNSQTKQQVQTND
ncbi:MAG: hypothetical protein KUG69_07075 [Marinosulfonomonas sp.]|nr:hypothetical protein [Marinosulfonomonas sp.]